MPVVKRSRHSFPETTRLLTEGIERAGSTVFVTIDQTEAARGVGLDLRPTCLIVFGNPRAGTPLMDAVPLAALALPLKLLVWENADAVDVAYVSVSEQAAALGIAADDSRIAAMDRALDTLSESVV